MDEGGPHRRRNLKKFYDTYEDQLPGLEVWEDTHYPYRIWRSRKKVEKSVFVLGLWEEKSDFKVLCDIIQTALECPDYDQAKALAEKNQRAFFFFQFDNKKWRSDIRLESGIVDGICVEYEYIHLPTDGFLFPSKLSPPGSFSLSLQKLPIAILAQKFGLSPDINQMVEKHRYCWGNQQFEIHIDVSPTRRVTFVMHHGYSQDTFQKARK